MRGPLEVGGAPKLLTIVLRRYLCRRCSATLTVGPLGLVARRLFSAAAMGLALCLWGEKREPAAKVRTALNPLMHVGDDAARGWRQLGRWARAIWEGRLFFGLMPGAPPPLRRAVAERAAAAMAARCPAGMCGDPLPNQVFAGAALAA